MTMEQRSTHTRDTTVPSGPSHSPPMASFTQPDLRTVPSSYGRTVKDSTAFGAEVERDLQNRSADLFPFRRWEVIWARMDSNLRLFLSNRTTVQNLSIENPLRLETRALHGEGVNAGLRSIAAWASHQTKLLLSHLQTRERCRGYVRHYTC
jgi:hypothetical protein